MPDHRILFTSLMGIPIATYFLEKKVHSEIKTITEFGFNLNFTTNAFKICFNLKANHEGHLHKRIICNLLVTSKLTIAENWQLLLARMGLSHCGYLATTYQDPTRQSKEN